jgi:hypothetical protein
MMVVQIKKEATMNQIFEALHTPIAALLLLTIVALAWLGGTAAISFLSA